MSDAREPKEGRGRGIRQILREKPPRGRDDPRYWREQIERWERQKERDPKKRRLSPEERAQQPFERKPEKFWQEPDTFWQAPESFWQEPEPLKDAVIEEAIRPLGRKLARDFEDYLRKLWLIRRVDRQRDHVRGMKGYLRQIRRQWEEGAIKFVDYLRTLKAIYALLKLLDARRRKRQEEKQRGYRKLQEKKQQRSSKDAPPYLPKAAITSMKKEGRLLVDFMTEAVLKEAKGDGLAEQFLQETGMGSVEEIEVVPGLKLKLKDESSDEGSSADDDSSSDSDTKEDEKTKTPQEEKASRKWMALAAKLRAEATGLDKKEAKKVLKEFGKAVAVGDDKAARKALHRAKNSTELWKWAKDKFFKSKG